MNELSVINELVPVLKNYLSLSEKDRETTVEVLKELKIAIKETRDCSVGMKVQIEHLKTHSEMLTTSCDNRKNECFKKHDVFEKKLESVPSVEMMAVRDKELNALKVSMQEVVKIAQKISIKVYVAMGVLGVIFTILQLSLPFVLKSLK